MYTVWLVCFQNRLGNRYQPTKIFADVIHARRYCQQKVDLYKMPYVVVGQDVNEVQDIVE